MSQAPQLPRPVPLPDKFTQFYWDSAKRHKLAILRCQDCGTFIHMPRPLCRGCLSSNLAPHDTNGLGTVYTFTQTHYIYHPYWADKAPYVVALVELEEDPSVRIVSNIVECPIDQVHIGMPVEVVFEELADEVSIPQFRPRQSPS